VIDHLEEFRVDQTLGEIFRILKSGGWLYITDVNPYFELLEEPYAKFIDKDGIQQRIKVFPHTVEMVFKSFAKAGFPTPKVTEAKVTQAIANKWNIENLKDFPLILEYFVQKS
jgi:predicted SAM-dependent methyltransferase